MAEETAGAQRDRLGDEEEEVSLLARANMLLRWRSFILRLAIVFGVVALAATLLSPRQYASKATFEPQGADPGGSGLSAAASQFGIRLAPLTPTPAWAAPMYVDLVATRTFLEPIALDTVTVMEDGARRVAITDLLKVGGATPAERTEAAVIALRKLIDVKEEKKLAAVTVSVATRWASVSLWLTRRVLTRVNEFNVQTRKSVAIAEAKFTDEQAAEASRVLREAEDRLQEFTNRNRAIVNSPELSLERDRLQREVLMRQQLYSNWMQSREDARIRVVRDTPVITVLEEPRLALVPQRRASLRKGIYGGFAGALLAIVIALAAEWIAELRRAPTGDLREFLRLLDEAIPNAIKPGGALRSALRARLGFLSKLVRRG